MITLKISYIILILLNFVVLIKNESDMKMKGKLIELTNGSPSLFKKLGTIYITYGFIHLRTTIDIGKYISNCEILKKDMKLKQFEMEGKLSTEHLGKHPIFRQIYYSTEKKIAKIGKICDKLIHTNLIFQNDKDNREKRSITLGAAAVGTFVTAITGIFTTAEVMKLEQKFQDVQEDVEEIDNILKAVNLRISHMEEKFNNITSETIKVAEELYLAVKTSEIFAFNLEIDLLAEQLQDMSQMVCDTVQDILQGHLPVHLMESEDLDVIFQKLTVIAERNGLQVPMQKSFELYNMPTTYILNKGIQCFTHIPIFSKKVATFFEFIYSNANKR